MFQRINQHFQVYNALVPQQYRFWKGLSTANTSCKLTNSIFKAWNKKMYVSVFFCDLVKVFDLWIIKSCCLNYYGIQGEIFNWVKSYLCNRKQRVELQSSKKFYCSWDIVLRAQCWVLFFLIYSLMFCPWKLNHLLRW